MREPAGVGLLVLLSVFFGVLLAEAFSTQDYNNTRSPQYYAEKCLNESSASVTTETIPKCEEVAEPPGWWEAEDLEAQRQMAIWTRRIGWFTAFGLVALFWTLFETRVVTKETRRIGETQTRGYVEATVKAITIGERNANALCTFEAHGHSPVYSVCPNFKFDWVGPSRGMKNFRFADDQFPEPFSMDLFPNAKPKEKRWGGNSLAFDLNPMPPHNPNDIISIQADMSLHWRDVFGNRFRQGIRFYGRRLSDDPHTIIDVAQQWTGKIELVERSEQT